MNVVIVHVGILIVHVVLLDKHECNTVKIKLDITVSPWEYKNLYFLPVTDE